MINPIKLNSRFEKSQHMGDSEVKYGEIKFSENKTLYVALRPCFTIVKYGLNYPLVGLCHITGSNSGLIQSKYPYPQDVIKKYIDFDKKYPHIKTRHYVIGGNEQKLSKSILEEMVMMMNSNNMDYELTDVLKIDELEKTLRVVVVNASQKIFDIYRYEAFKF